MTTLNVTHVKPDSCCAQRKVVYILISNILDFKEQYLGTNCLLSGFNTEKEDADIPSSLSSQPPTNLTIHLEQTAFHISLFIVSIFFSKHIHHSPILE